MMMSFLNGIVLLKESDSFLMASIFLSIWLNNIAVLVNFLIICFTIKLTVPSTFNYTHLYADRSTSICFSCRVRGTHDRTL
jgi:hypothetical protein